MVISDEPNCAELFRALEAASSPLARNVNPTIYRSAELARRGDEHASFLVKVLEQPKIPIIGEKMTSPLEHLEASAQLHPEPSDSREYAGLGPEVWRTAGFRPQRHSRGAQ
jgi:hypothetical protein